MGELLTKDILYFGTPLVLACDGCCQKAWGINNRPRVYLQGEDIDPDDYYHMADGELPNAPADPGTYEGGEPKPHTPEMRLNKWCARECERNERALESEITQASGRRWLGEEEQGERAEHLEELQDELDDTRRELGKL